jgi:hypothetical protein
VYKVGKRTEEESKEKRNDDTTGNRWETNSEERRGGKNTKGIEKKNYYPLSNFVRNVSNHNKKQTQFLKLHWRFFCTETEVNNKNYFENLVLCCTGL